MNKRICPRCKRKYSERPAISRVDNRTKICPTCGLSEALISKTINSYKKYFYKRKKSSNDGGIYERRNH